MKFPMLYPNPTAVFNISKRTTLEVEDVLKSPTELVALAGIGFIVGVISGFFGIGGGVVMVPSLVLLFGWDLTAAAGTSLAAMVLTSFAGAYKSYLLGHVVWPVAGIIGAFSVIGSYLVGVPLIDSMEKYYSQEFLRRIFGFLLLIVALRMIGVFTWLWNQFAR